MERRVRIVVTLGLIAALMGLMLINVEPEIDLSVDQLMETPDDYEGGNTADPWDHFDFGHFKPNFVDAG